MDDLSISLFSTRTSSTRSLKMHFLFCDTMDSINVPNNILDNDLPNNESPVKPILIMGAPGSGTTVLYEILCTHRALAYVTLNMLRAGITRHGRIMGDRRSALFALENLVHRDWPSRQPHEANAFWIRYFGSYDYLTEKDFTPAMAAYYEKNILRVQKLWNRPRFINKNLQPDCVRVRLLGRIFLDAKFIHIIRDGRAVAYSILNKKEAGVTPTMFLFSLRKILGEKYRPERSELFNYGLAWTELVTKARQASMFGQDRYLEVRYESLVTRPYEEFRKIIEFCELEGHSEFEQAIPRTSNMNTKWRQDASNEQRKDLEESTFELRQDLGIV